MLIVLTFEMHPLPRYSYFFYFYFLLCIEPLGLAYLVILPHLVLLTAVLRELATSQQWAGVCWDLLRSTLEELKDTDLKTGVY
jgi:hypothetical protein